MISDNELSKVSILIEQEKYSDAERTLKQLLSVDANNIDFLILFSEVNLRQDKLEIANTVINNVIGLSPEIPDSYYIKSRIEIQQDNYIEAEKNIKQSIHIDPFDADYFALLASIKLAQKDFNEALKFADKALEIDPENILGLNIRSSSLIKLNKSEDAFDTIEGALREDPNNPYTHANYGWGLLEKGNHKKALNHFKEALNNDPNFEYAQSGMLEAIKASNPIYRYFLKYSFWMSNLTSKYQWRVIIGFYIGFKIIQNVAKKVEALQPYATPIIAILVLLAVSTWIINPISNLFLRLNKYGRLLLDKKEKISSNFVGISLLTSALGLLAYFITSDEKFLTIAAFGFAMMIPFSVMFSPTKYKHAILIYTAALLVSGFTSIAITFYNGNIFNPVSTIFLFGFIAFQWIANYFIMDNNN